MAAAAEGTGGRDSNDVPAMSRPAAPQRNAEMGWGEREIGTPASPKTKNLFLSFVPSRKKRLKSSTVSVRLLARTRSVVCD